MTHVALTFVNRRKESWPSRDPLLEEVRPEVRIRNDYIALCQTVSLYYPTKPYDVWVLKRIQYFFYYPTKPYDVGTQKNPVSLLLSNQTL